MTAAPYLRLAGIRKSFGDFVALKDIALDIAAGEFVCFLGPSGCGKTTLLRIIAGLEQHSGGRIERDGRDISALPPADRDYGIVFQSYALFPNLSVADNVAYGLVNRRRPRGEITARVTELLAKVGLPGSEARFPAQLSGGQQQRVALARALATAPGLLLLDEPLSALDAIVRVRLRQELAALQRELGVTTIMVTHDQEEAMSVADRIVVMNHGTIEQVGTPMQIYRQPATLFVADFVGRVNSLPATRDADGALRLGDWPVPAAALAAATAATAAADPGGSTAVRPGGPGGAQVVLRPEDLRLLGWLAADDAPTLDDEAFEAKISKIEFLGHYCLLRVAAPRLAATLGVYLSVDELGGRGVGQRLVLRLRSGRTQVFA
jgi:iron(III) transport system ATP-binding protein